MKDPHKVWAKRSRLNRHQEGELHSELSTVMRAVEGQYFHDGTVCSLSFVLSVISTKIYVARRVRCASLSDMPS